jgi:hypothetical protein
VLPSDQSGVIRCRDTPASYHEGIDSLTLLSLPRKAEYIHTWSSRCEATSLAQVLVAGMYGSTKDFAYPVLFDPMLCTYRQSRVSHHIVNHCSLLALLATSLSHLTSSNTNPVTEGPALGSLIPSQIQHFDSTRPPRCSLASPRSCSAGSSGEIFPHAAAVACQV